MNQIPGITILAKWFLRYFVHQLTLAYTEKIEKGDNSVMDLQNYTKVNQVIYILDTICDSNIMTSTSGS